MDLPPGAAKFEAVDCCARAKNILPGKGSAGPSGRSAPCRRRLNRLARELHMIQAA
jgi:hypothetical protein